MAKIFHRTYNLFQEQTYCIVSEQGQCAVIDPGFCDHWEVSDFLSFLSENKAIPKAILLTHAHIDHCCGVDTLLKQFGSIPVYMHPGDKAILDNIEEMIAKFSSIPRPNFDTIDISDSEVIKVADLRFKVITTPGHSPGGVCYYMEDEQVMFTGDTLFAGSIGRTDLMFGDYDKLIVSIMEKLMPMDAGITIYPGHSVPSSIGRERLHNPFLEPFNEPESTESDLL